MPLPRALPLTSVCRTYVCVLSVKIKPTPYCEVTDAEMTYRDSTGTERKLAYRTLSEACRNQN